MIIRMSEDLYTFFKNLQNCCEKENVYSNEGYDWKHLDVKYEKQYSEKNSALYESKDIKKPGVVSFHLYSKQDIIEFINNIFYASFKYMYILLVFRGLKVNTDKLYKNMEHPNLIFYKPELEEDDSDETFYYEFTEEFFQILLKYGINMTYFSDDIKFLKEDKTSKYSHEFDCTFYHVHQEVCESFENKKYIPSFVDKYILETTTSECTQLISMLGFCLCNLIKDKIASNDTSYLSGRFSYGETTPVCTDKSSYDSIVSMPLDDIRKESEDKSFLSDLYDEDEDAEVPLVSVILDGMLDE